MTEYPLLCINPKCRAEDLGGPRRTNRSWICPTCADHAGEQLRYVADAWDDLEDALVRTGSVGEPVKGSREVGIDLNERAVAARARAAADLWAYARIVLEWADELGRTVTPPATSTTPTLARWIADWHLEVFASRVGRTTALAFVEDVRAIRDDVRRAAYPSGARKIPTGLRCTERGTSDMGEDVPCVGAMHAWVRPDADDLPDLVCDEDRTHRIDPATWQRAGWKAAALDAAGVDRLTRALRA